MYAMQPVDVLKEKLGIGCVWLFFARKIYISIQVFKVGTSLKSFAVAFMWSSAHICGVCLKMIDCLWM